MCLSSFRTPTRKTGIFCRSTTTTISTARSDRRGLYSASSFSVKVSAIIDVDLVPETCRRVRLVKHGTERPLGFYIRDGTSFRVTPAGVQKVTDMMVANSWNLIMTVRPANQRGAEAPPLTSAPVASVTPSTTPPPSVALAPAVTERRHSASMDSTSSGDSTRLDADGDTVLDHLVNTITITTPQIILIF
ncbi:unnamed protein product [Nesidiocoris tenuis]|uniref:Uncharacterized protein n=1 Tax=Nesidiocoris tenuis TaxID=355587 RepID=A0A6H5HQ55_9HEMI|nr:unnamed protein product [Nesidiocoris tenuis]